MEEDKKILASQEIHERARYIRGRFLNILAVIERDISLILRNYFCTADASKQHLFLKHIMGANGLSLSRKKEILFDILKADYPQYFSENKGDFNFFEKIITFRNKLAHSIVDVSERALNRHIKDGIGFKEWDDAKPITESDFNDWELKAKTISARLNDINRLLPHKEKN